ncbi:DUF6708 domain-containing protein [Paraburkholderia sp. BR10937]|uniref:DUF6708 domain-containing protein n=1 Tax=Paraburkholderia sp. BR10937 TaxID=3236994 RepID=UPI0034D3778B
MTYDYLTQVSINRRLTEEEARRRLDIHKSAAAEANDKHTVFRMNDVYLDVCDASYQQLGWGLLAFIIGFFPFAFLTWKAISTASEAAIFWTLVPFGVAGCIVCVLLLLRDCFGYRHKTVRFNRKNRMVYAFRHNGPGGVIAVPWDEAFFYAHRQTSGPMFGGAPTVMRCFVLAKDGKTIKDTFSFGLRTVNGGSESGRWGKLVLDQVLVNFEFIRRFMEQGPAGLPPVREYMPEGPSIKASFNVYFHDFKEARETNSFMNTLGAIIAAPMLVMVLLHFIAQITGRKPVWPEEVQRASQSNESSSAIVT